MIKKANQFNSNYAIFLPSSSLLIKKGEMNLVGLPDTKART